MICVAKPYPRRISTKLAVWAFKRTGLKPSDRNYGDRERTGCLLTAIYLASRSTEPSLKDFSVGILGESYVLGLWDGWDNRRIRYMDAGSFAGSQDAIAARAALSAAGIVA